VGASQDVTERNRRCVEAAQAQGASEADFGGRGRRRCRVHLGQGGQQGRERPPSIPIDPIALVAQGESGLLAFDGA